MVTGSWQAWKYLQKDSSTNGKLSTSKSSHAKSTSSLLLKQTPKSTRIIQNLITFISTSESCLVAASNLCNLSTTLPWAWRTPPRWCSCPGASLPFMGWTLTWDTSSYKDFRSENGKKKLRTSGCHGLAYSASKNTSYDVCKCKHAWPQWYKVQPTQRTQITLLSLSNPRPCKSVWLDVPWIKVSHSRDVELDRRVLWDCCWWSAKQRLASMASVAGFATRVKMLQNLQKIVWAFLIFCFKNKLIGFIKSNSCHMPGFLHCPITRRPADDSQGTVQSAAYQDWPSESGGQVLSSDHGLRWCPPAIPKGNSSSKHPCSSAILVSRRVNHYQGHRLNWCSRVWYVQQAESKVDYN